VYKYDSDDLGVTLHRESTNIKEFKMSYATKGARAFIFLAPLVLSACVWQSDYDALKAENQRLQQQNAATQQQLAAERAQTTRLGGALLYTVNSDMAFASGSWQLTAAGKDTIATIAKKLAPGKEKLVVKGYTDNVPVGAALAQKGVTSNEILSQKRAEAVMEYIVSQGFNPSLMRAQGMGDANPVASNNSASGRAQNRRVEISVDQ
jgi:chemotaxis protein MotB